MDTALAVQTEAYKLRYVQLGGSDRHLNDIARMMQVSGATVDRSQLDLWIARLGLSAEWAKVARTGV